MHDNPTADFAVWEEIIFQLFEMRMVLAVEMRIYLTQEVSLATKLLAIYLPLKKDGINVRIQGADFNVIK